MVGRVFVGVSLTTALVAFGAVNVGAANRRGSLPGDVPPPAASGFPGSSGPPREAIEASRVREARLRESWQTRAARDERERGRRRFKDLSRADARALAERRHPSVFSSEVWAPLRGVTRRGELLDSYSARVTLPNGTNAVAVSSLPLRARDEDGNQRPVDLDLVPDSGGLRPENPLVDTVIPARSSDLVRVGDVAFGLGGDVPVQLENDRAFYADAGGRDIDLIVMPTPSGVESFAQIRSVDAPEEVRMPFDLPPGAQLRGVVGAADGVLEIVRGGEVIATVTRPSAVDAQQRPVPVEYRVEGDDLVMTVEHRSGDFAMPIMVDPSVVYGWNNNPRRYDATGWGVYQSSPGSRWCSYFGDSYLGYGQYTFGRPESGQPCANTSYAPYEVYEWNYYGEYSRGSTAFVEGWDEGYNFDVGWGGTCHYSGIYSVALRRWETFSGNECGTVWGTIRYHRSSGTPPNYAVFGTVINGSGRRQNFTNQLWGATVYVSDRDNPTVEQGPRRIPTAWTKETVFDVTARDAGIGVDWTQIRLSAPNQPDHLESRLHPCSADPSNHCPQSDTFSYSTNNMPEGVRTVSAQAGDLIRVPAFSALGPIKIDRTGPEIDAVRGSLKNRENRTLYESEYSVSVDAHDGSPQARRSGVAKAELLVDGNVAATSTTTCSSGECPYSASQTLTLRTDQLEGGARNIAVRITDAARNSKTSSEWTVFVGDDVAPESYATGLVADRDGSFFGPGVYDVTVNADDDDGVGVARVWLKRSATGTTETRGAPCAAGCPSSFGSRFEIDTRALPEGMNDFVLGGADAVGNEAGSDELTLFVDSIAPTPPSRIELTDHDADTGLTTLDWMEGNDPPGGEDAPASGIAFTEYRIRRGGVWSDWRRVEGSDATLEGFQPGEQVEVELRTVDYVGNTSLLPVARTLTVPQERATANRGGFTTQQDSGACTPKLDYIRERTSKADYERFKEEETSLGAQLRVFCNAGSEVRTFTISARLAVETGEDEYTAVGKADPQKFEPREQRDVKVRGINAVCSAARAGSRKYIVVGEIKYDIEGGGDGESQDFNTDPDDAEEQTCPSFRVRRAREEAGWRYLRRRSPDGGGRGGQPSFYLGQQLGDRPFAPKGARLPWAAHHVVPAKGTEADDAGDLHALLFRCAVHPNSRTNGIYLRNGGERGLRKTMRDGRPNPRFTELQQRAPELARRTYHPDTFPFTYVAGLRDRLRDLRDDNEEKCPTPDTLQVRNVLSRAKSELEVGAFGVEQEGH